MTCELLPCMLLQGMHALHSVEQTIDLQYVINCSWSSYKINSFVA